MPNLVKSSQSTSKTSSLEANMFTFTYSRSLPTWKSLKYTIKGSNDTVYVVATKFKTLKVRSTLQLFEVKRVGDPDPKFEGSGSCSTEKEKAFDKVKIPTLTAADTIDVKTTTQDDLTLRGVSIIGFVKSSPYQLSIIPGSEADLSSPALMQQSLPTDYGQPFYQLENIAIACGESSDTKDQAPGRRLIYWKRSEPSLKHGYEQHDYELMRKPHGASQFTAENGDDGLIAVYTSDDTKSWLKVRSLKFAQPVDRETELWALLSCITLVEKKRLYHTRVDVSARMLWHDRVERCVAKLAKLPWTKEREASVSQEEEPDIRAKSQAYMD
jgi:hypothetical protein